MSHPDRKLSDSVCRLPKLLTTRRYSIIQFILFIFIEKSIFQPRQLRDGIVRDYQTYKE